MSGEEFYRSADEIDHGMGKTLAEEEQFHRPQRKGGRVDALRPGGADHHKRG